jgi:hypothetical protein
MPTTLFSFFFSVFAKKNTCQKFKLKIFLGGNKLDTNLAQNKGEEENTNLG